MKAAALLTLIAKQYPPRGVDVTSAKEPK